MSIFRIIVLYLSFAFSIATVIALYLIPFSTLSKNFEIILSCVSLLCFISVSISNRNLNKYIKRVNTIKILLFFLLFVFGLARHTAYRNLTWVCDGTVVDKCISDNHSIKKISIKGRIDANFSGVENVFWEKVKIGDKLKKEEWSEYCLLNNDIVRIVNRVSLLNHCYNKLSQPKRINGVGPDETL